MILPRRKSALLAMARSRRHPARAEAGHISPLRLWFDMTVGWRFASLALGPVPQDFIATAQALRQQAERLDDAALSKRIADLSIGPEAMASPAGPELFAYALEVIRRETGLVLRPSQIQCAHALLSGECIEMRTGEGKTLAAALAALVAARMGVFTHVLTVNDYLAARDAAQIAPMAARMGLGAAVVLQSMPDDEKRRAYDSDIVYATNKTVVFDYLRDRREARQGQTVAPRQMGQSLAICDEADSVLIDDATVPMILSEPGPPVPAADIALFRALLGFADGAGPDTCRIDPQGRPRLTSRGIAQLVRQAQGWPHAAARSEEIIDLAETALAARMTHREGEAYVIANGEVTMIDQGTGRLMGDRKWAYGLQQMIELTAGVPLSPETVTVGQVTQQTYYRQYLALSGLTGTARECRAELWSIYRLPVRRIAPHAPLRLSDLGLRLFRSPTRKWRACMERALDMASNRAVLIGVNDVRESQQLAALFAGAGHPVAVLDALSEAQEAAVIAQAGQAGQITIATHLAGRGSDIALAPEVRQAGGLHVIIASAMASSRLERQFYGRAGRAGDPGSYERLACLDDASLRGMATTLSARALRRWLGLGLPMLGAAALARLQTLRDARAQVARKRSLLREQELVEQLGYK